MQKLKVLLIVLLVATSGLAVSMYLLALIFEPGKSPLDVLSELMMGVFPPGLSLFIPLSSLLFLITILASMVGVVYFIALPEMKEYLESEPANNDATELVLKTLKPDERKVVSILRIHGGTYLQKFISQETGMSRLKTHRVVATLSERGIVYIERKGNSNEVSLAKWLVGGKENGPEKGEREPKEQHPRNATKEQQIGILLKNFKLLNPNVDPKVIDFEDVVEESRQVSENREVLAKYYPGYAWRKREPSPESP